MQVLCLQLQRVRWSSSGSPEKLHGHVAFPLSLDLSPYLATAARPLLGRTLSEPTQKEEGLAFGRRGAPHCDSEDAKCRFEPARSAYRLVAVTVHHGGPKSGHYTTYRNVLRMSDRCSNELWVSVSDEDVRDADVREVLACQASILFYERTHV